MIYVKVAVVFLNSFSQRKCVKVLVAQSCLTLWTVACQAPLSTEFSRQVHWSGLPFPTQGIFPTQGLNRGLPHCRQILYHLSHQGSPFPQRK